MPIDVRNFFIGLTDFFTIILPGAILTAAILLLFGAELAGLLAQVPDGFASWALLFAASYIVGHILFQLGSLLDDLLYEPLNRLTRDGQIEAVAAGRRRRPVGPVVRKLLDLVLPGSGKRKKALKAVRALRDDRLGALGKGEPMNAYQFSKAWLAERQFVTGRDEVLRLEADSKFFRSLAVLIIALTALWAWREPLPALWVMGLAALLLFSLWRYFERRVKAIGQAYTAVLVHHAANPLPEAKPKKKSADEPIRAGGVVYRRYGRTTEYLLVSASDKVPKRAGTRLLAEPDGSTAWVLPKGKAEIGEDPPATAVREVLEEAGVWARPLRYLGRREFGAAKAKLCDYYLMEHLDSDARPENDRFVRWITSRSLQARTHTQGISEDILALLLEVDAKPLPRT